MTPQAATAIPFKAGDEAWLLARGIPSDLIEHMIEIGAFVVEGERDGNRNSTPSLKSEQRTPRQQVMVCQRCNRAIPTDANCCPYCAHPVSIPAAAKTPKKVSRKASNVGDPATRTQGGAAGITSQAVPIPLTTSQIAHMRASVPEVSIFDQMIAEGVIVEQNGDQKENRQ
jgi:hypothetical protein